MSGWLRSGPGPGLARYFFGPGPGTRTALFQITVPILSAHSLFYPYHVRWPLYSLKNSVWTIFTLSRRRWIPCSAHFLSIEPCFFPVYPRRLYSSRSSPDILELQPAWPAFLQSIGGKVHVILSQGLFPLIFQIPLYKTGLFPEFCL